MGYLQTPLMKRMYPKGYPHEHSKICNSKEPYSGSDGATCIIDNEHPGRPHFGSDSNGNYRQWASLVK